jgi:hypothetical protein
MIKGLNINFHVNFKKFKQIERTFNGRLLFVHTHTHTHTHIYIDVQTFIENLQNKQIFLIVLLKLSCFDKQINVTNIFQNIIASFICATTS